MAPDGAGQRDGRPHSQICNRTRTPCSRWLHIAIQAAGIQVTSDGLVGVRRQALS
ncbi:MAG: hypothetical protein V3S25_07860 [Nitrospirales bacterium]